MKQSLLLLCFTVTVLAAKTQSVSDSIANLVKYYHDNGMFNGSVLVANGNNIVYKGAVGMANHEWQLPNTTQTRFRLGSVTKQFTATLILQLVQEGKLNLNGKITDYLTNYRKETGSQVSIHHLLTHSSGIPNYTDNESFFPNSVKPYSVTDFVRIYCSGDLEFKPGAQFSYSNSGYFILGAILEKLTGKTYEQLLKEKILEPLGMKQTGYDMHEYIISGRASGYEKKLAGYQHASYLDMGLPYAAGSLYSSVEDLMIWNLALYGNRLLADSLKQKMFNGYLELDKNIKAGYGWFIEQIPMPDTNKVINMIWHNGGINGFMTELARFPEEKIFITVLDNASNNTTLLFRDILAKVYGLPLEPKKPTLAHTIRKKIESSSIAEAADYFATIPESEKQQYELAGSERLINSWGYERMNEQQDLPGALKLFELNTKLFPGSSNVYDSYGEALANAGKYDQAVVNYQKSVQLDSSRYRRASVRIAAFSNRPDTVRVLVDGHEMVLYKSGTKGPVIVLEAGGNADHTCWSMIVPELAKRAIVITYDRPGFRKSVPCPKPRTSDRVAAELYEALNKAGIKGPYIIGGWSWGGAFARTFAGKYPAETKGLLLIDPVSKEVYDRMAADYPDIYTGIFATRFASNQAAQDEYDAMTPAMMQASISDRHYKGKIEVLAAGSFKEWSEAEVPLKKIWIDELRTWSGKNKNSRFELVESGHFIQNEKPQTVIAALNRLMDTK
jgi:CubicO group peptidase (beta-lactamase class C family)/pimeloyl-ACP methyl ester carboxylesterase